MPVTRPTTALSSTTPAACFTIDGSTSGAITVAPMARCIDFESATSHIIDVTVEVH